MEKILLCAMLFFAISLSAQDWDKLKYGTIGIDYQQLDFADFNEAAKNLGFPALDESMVDISGGFTTQNGHWNNYYFFALGLNEASAAGNGPETRYQHAGVGWGTSYGLLDPNKPLFIGPEVQFLFRGEQMVLAENAEVSNLTNAVGAEYSKFTRFGAPIDLGLNFHYALTVNANKPSYMVIALRAGYRLESDANWQLDQAVDIEESGINPGGFYAGLRIGARLY